MRVISKLNTLLFIFILAVSVISRADDGGKEKTIAPVIERYTKHLAHGLSYVWGTDPFLKTPGFAPYKEAPVTHNLHAVIYSKTERSAIVDDREVYVGSMIDDYRVSEIGRNYVLLDNGTSLKELVVPAKPVTSHADIEALRAPAGEEPENEK